MNALWSWLFFYWKSGAGSFACIIVLWLMIALVIALFARVRPISAALLVPYLAWVTFAVALNYAVWQRNPLLLG